MAPESESSPPPKSLLLDQFKKSLMQLRSTAQTCEMVVDFLSDYFHGTAGICIWDQDQGAFTVWPDDLGLEVRFRVFDPFLLFLADHDRIFLREDFASRANYDSNSTNPNRWWNNGRGLPPRLTGDNG